MSVASRRLMRSTAPAGSAGVSVRFYTGENYTGEVMTATQYDDLPSVGLFDNRIQSIRFAAPCKLYLHEQSGLKGQVLFFDGSADIPNLTNRYYADLYGVAEWKTGITGVEVRPASYSMPLAQTAPVNLPYGKIIPNFPGSNRFSHCCDIQSVSQQIDDQTTYTTFTDRIPPAQLVTAMKQMARNVCAVMFANPDHVLRHTPIISMVYKTQFSSPAYATTMFDEITLYDPIKELSDISYVMTHELAHTYQYWHDKYGINQYVTGVVEGMAEYVTVVTGYIGAAGSRPAGGGTNWYDGYETTAFFFDYIVRSAPTPSPDFVRKLLRTMDQSNPSIGNADWSPSVIADCNVRYMSVDNLWTEYKAWVAASSPALRSTAATTPPRTIFNTSLCMNR